MRTHLCFVIATLVAAPAIAQDSRSLEGMTVTLKMDMPASSDGVEVRPLAGGVDIRRVASSIHTNGIGVHSGESIMITKVVVKDRHIEVHLGGGGYGTFSDVLASSASTPYVPYQTKSRHEKDLEDQAKYSPDYWDRQAARDDLHKEQRDRYRDNTVAAAINTQAQAAKKANERALRAQGGSRFNIRYNDGFPTGATTADGIINALSQYVDFSGARSPSTAAPAPAAPGLGSSLRKGLTIPQVEQVLGPAAKVSEKTEGSIQTVIREYSADNQQVVAQFVSGVLVDYRITPR
jgi:hypothetical protein